MDPCIVDDSVEIPTICSFVIEFVIPKFIESSTCFEPCQVLVEKFSHTALPTADYHMGI
jgi:hypothetical protein